MSIPIYESSFTPYGEKEDSKGCPKCKLTLDAKKFKPSHVTRNGIKGIARNMKCRKCESNVTESKKGERTSKIEIELEEQRKEIDKIKIDFSKVIKSMKEEIRILKLEIESLSKCKKDSNLFD